MTLRLIDLPEDKVDILSGILSSLTEREEKVIRMRCFDSEHHYTLLEIAKKFDCTSERIRQIESKALRKIFRALLDKIGKN